MKQKIIALIALLLPPLLFHIWNGNNEVLNIILYLCIVSIIGLFIALVIGIRKRSFFLIAALPIFLVSTFLCFIIINTQTARNQKNAELIIEELKKYKIKNGTYPTTTSQLVPSYLGEIPKQWFLIHREPYEYKFDQENKSFSLSVKVGLKTTHIWDSGLDQWQFVD